MWKPRERGGQAPSGALLPSPGTWRLLPAGNAFGDVERLYANSGVVGIPHRRHPLRELRGGGPHVVPRSTACQKHTCRVRQPAIGERERLLRVSLCTPSKERLIWLELASSQKGSGHLGCVYYQANDQVNMKRRLFLRHRVLVVSQVVFYTSLVSYPLAPCFSFNFTFSHPFRSSIVL